MCVRERERVQEEEYLEYFLTIRITCMKTLTRKTCFLQGMKWRAHFGRSVKNCWMRMEFGINFVKHGFKRASIKKILSTTKTKDQDHVELYDISSTKLSSNSRWSSPLFWAEIDEQIKRIEFSYSTILYGCHITFSDSEVIKLFLKILKLKIKNWNVKI